MEKYMSNVDHLATAKHSAEYSPNMPIRIPKDSTSWGLRDVRLSALHLSLIARLKILDRTRQIILFMLALLGVFLMTGIILVILTPDQTMHVIPPASAHPSQEISIPQPYAGSFIVTSDDTGNLAFMQLSRSADHVQGIYTQVVCHKGASTLDAISVSGNFLSGTALLLKLGDDRHVLQTTVYAIIATAPDDSSYTFSYIDTTGHTRFIRLTRTAGNVMQSNAAMFCQQHASGT